MKRLLASLFMIFSMVGCTLPPLAFEDDATSQSVNQMLICSKKIDVYPLSINGVNPPKESFDLYIKKLKKYTTDNVVVHKTMNIAVKEDKVNDFVQGYGGGGMHLYDLVDEEKDGQRFSDFRKKTMESDSAIVMIYTPELLCGNKRHLRGYAFPYSDRTNIVAYNATTINDAPVISDTQAWKIVLTHEVGHRLGVPANKDHNKAGHCTSRECIMYARPDWQAVVSVLFHGMPYDFCDKCKAELEEGKKSCDTMYGMHPDPEYIWRKK
jgi:hypothetical protein